MTPNRFSQPEGACIDDAGNIYVADAKKDSIFKFTPFGDELQSFGGPTVFSGPYGLTVTARRTLHLRLGQLERPQRLPRETDFACAVRSSRPVVAQHTRLDSRQAELGLLSTIATAKTDAPSNVLQEVLT